MQIKIDGGTLKGSEDLCQSCTNATIRDDDHGNKNVYCDTFHRMILTKTLKCSGYFNKSLPQLYELLGLAWAYIPRVGFKKYGDLTKEEIKKFGG